MRRCGEQTNELHISHRERKGKRVRKERERGEVVQQRRCDDRDIEMREGGKEGEETGDDGRGSEEEG